jgi:glutamyl-tRNA reductase
LRLLRTDSPRTASAVTGASAATPRLFAAGLDHRSAALELRDRIFVPEGELPGFHAELRRAGIAQAIVLSTCDRVEVMGAHPDPAAAAAAAIRLFAQRAGVLEFRAHHLRGQGGPACRACRVRPMR